MQSTMYNEKTSLSIQAIDEERRSKLKQDSTVVMSHVRPRSKSFQADERDILKVFK